MIELSIQIPEEYANRNASLFIAAPKMYEALKQALPLLRAHHKATTEGAATICVIEAALKAADGEV